MAIKDGELVWYRCTIKDYSDRLREFGVWNRKHLFAVELYDCHEETCSEDSL